MSKRLKVENGSGNAFRDVGFDEREANNLALRAELMARVREIVKRGGLSQSAAARSLGITQPRLNDLLRGRIEKFSLDALVNVLARAGMQVRMTVRKAA